MRLLKPTLHTIPEWATKNACSSASSLSVHTISLAQQPFVSCPHLLFDSISDQFFPCRLYSSSIACGFPKPAHLWALILIVSSACLSPSCSSLRLWADFRTFCRLGQTSSLVLPWFCVYHSPYICTFICYLLKCLSLLLALTLRTYLIDFVSLFPSTGPGM